MATRYALVPADEEDEMFAPAVISRRKTGNSFLRNIAYASLGAAALGALGSVAADKGYLSTKTIDTAVDGAAKGMNTFGSLFWNMATGNYMQASNLTPKPQEPPTFTTTQPLSDPHNALADPHTLALNNAQIASAVGNPPQGGTLVVQPAPPQNNVLPAAAQTGEQFQNNSQILFAASTPKKHVSAAVSAAKQKFAGTFWRRAQQARTNAEHNAAAAGAAGISQVGTKQSLSAAMNAPFADMTKQVGVLPPTTPLSLGNLVTPAQPMAVDDGRKFQLVRIPVGKPEKRYEALDPNYNISQASKRNIAAKTPAKTKQMSVSKLEKLLRTARDKRVALHNHPVDRYPLPTDFDL